MAPYFIGVKKLGLVLRAYRAYPSYSVVLTKESAECLCRLDRLNLVTQSRKRVKIMKSLHPHNLRIGPIQIHEHSIPLVLLVPIDNGRMIHSAELHLSIIDRDGILPDESNEIRHTLELVHVTLFPHEERGACCVVKIHISTSQPS